MPYSLISIRPCVLKKWFNIIELPIVCEMLTRNRNNNSKMSISWLEKQTDKPVNVVMFLSTPVEASAQP